MNRVLAGTVHCRIRLEVVTGVHIGGSEQQAHTGAVHLPGARSPLDGAPVIPGRSLRGKMRSLLESALGLPPRPDLLVYRHECAEWERAEACPVCRVFGAGASEGTEGFREDGRLRVSVRPSPTARLWGVEEKTENALDRVTTAAVPRTLERIVPGAQFEVSLTYRVYEGDRLDASRADLMNLATVLGVLQDDVLGGGGTRGSGKVSLAVGSISVRSLDGASPWAPTETPSVLDAFRAAAEDGLPLLFGGEEA